MCTVNNKCVNLDLFSVNEPCLHTFFYTIAVSPITGHVIGNQNLTFVQSPSKSGEFRFGDKGLSKIKDGKSRGMYQELSWI